MTSPRSSFLSMSSCMQLSSSSSSGVAIDIGKDLEPIIQAFKVQMYGEQGKEHKGQEDAEEFMRYFLNQASTELGLLRDAYNITLEVCHLPGNLLSKKGYSLLCLRPANRIWRTLTSEVGLIVPTGLCFFCIMGRPSKNEFFVS